MEDPEFAIRMVEEAVPTDNLQSYSVSDHEYYQAAHDEFQGFRVSLVNKREMTGTEKESLDPSTSSTYSYCF